jgi:hypothetical protein
MLKYQTRPVGTGTVLSRWRHPPGSTYPLGHPEVGIIGKDLSEINKDTKAPDLEKHWAWSTGFFRNPLLLIGSIIFFGPLAPLIKDWVGDNHKVEILIYKGTSFICQDFFS